MSREITRLDIDQSEKEQRIRQEAAELNDNCQRLSWQLVKLAEISPSFRHAGIRQGSINWLKGYLVDYGKANRAADKPEINVSQPIDAEIPFEEKALADYLSVVGIWVAGINFLKKDFGKEVDEDVSQSLNHVADLFPEAAIVFNQSQTSFERGQQGGLKFKLLHYIDKSRNAAPSLHVEIAAYAYSRLTDIIDKYAKDSKNLYEPIKQALFQRAVRILEAALLVKQHVVMDVGLGLAALSSKENSFVPERAHKIIDAMFEENKHGMDVAVIAKIRQTIKDVYDEVMAKIAAQPDVPPAQILVEYLQNFNQA